MPAWALPDRAVTADYWPGRLLLDDSTRVLDNGRVVIGGSPLKILKLSSRGAALLRSLTTDEARPSRGSANRCDVTASSLAARLVDGGLAHPHPTEGPFSATDVTVVVPVFRSASALAHTLAALWANTPDLAAVVVVDDASPDSDTPRRVAAGWDRTHVVRHGVNRGPAAARNTGLADVSTDLVAFVDAGCEPQPGWLEPLLRHFADPQLAVAAPRIVSARPPCGLSPRRGTVASRYQQTRSSLDLGARTAPVQPGTRVAYIPAAAMLCRTADIRAVGGFDVEMRVGEDVDLVWRLDAAGRRVRYEPAAEVSHDNRTRLADWSRRRFEYGTSAAPLARRHEGALSPVTTSAWSAASWCAVGGGHPLVGAALGVASTALLARKLEHVPSPWRQAARLAGRGNIGAGRLLASAITGPWWPFAALACVFSRRARRCVVAAFTLPSLIEWVADRPPLDPVRWIALRALDDMSYGAGVVAGCARERIADPLMPTFYVSKRRRSAAPQPVGTDPRI